MKKITVVLALMLSAAVSHANVYVSWGAYAGLYWSANDGAGFLGAGQSALAQLIWSANVTADAAMYGSVNLVSGDDVWLADLVLQEGGNTSEWGDFLAPNFDDNGVRPAGGYIYARVFENAAPQVGDWYYVGIVKPADNIVTGGETPAVPQDYELNRNYGDPINGAFGAQVVPVPEPGTIALFALGVATLAASRRRRKAA